MRRASAAQAIIDDIAEMFKAGIIDKTGKFVINLGTNRVRQDADGKPEYVLAWAEETSINTDITVTQADVRALQLVDGLFNWRRLAGERGLVSPEVVGLDE